MRILAIDTATEACSVALWNDGALLRPFRTVPTGTHPTHSAPGKSHVPWRNPAWRLTDLDALAFGRGPGSFTGVRIGIGIAQGLALGAELPMIGVSTLANHGAGRMAHDRRNARAGRD